MHKEETREITDRIYTIDEIKEMSAKIFENYGIEKAYVFGSYSRGEATPKSDIDIMIKKGKLTSLFQLNGMCNALMDIFHKYVDVITEETYLGNDGAKETDEFVIQEKEKFIKIVLEERKLIYG